MHTPNIASRMQLAAVLAIAAVAVAISMYSVFLVGPYNDNLTYFSLFRDNAYSLNRFGEPAWWLPHINFGHAGYVTGALGPSAQLSPAAMLFWIIAWVAGRLGIFISDFRLLYAAYAFVALPLLLVVCAWLATWRFSPALRVAATGLIAFSPIMVQNISDPGLIETAAYSLICYDALWRLIARPGRRALIWCLIAFSLLLHTLNFAFFFWGVPFLVMLAFAIAGPRSSRLLLKRVRLSKVQWTAAVLAMIVAVAPFFDMFWKFREFTKPGFSAGGYSVGSLVPGNPMGVLLVSTPGVNFLWNKYRPDFGEIVQFLPNALGPANALGYVYLGALILPLAIVGLWYGRLAARWRLGAIMLALVSVVMLSGFSPVYAMASLVVPILRMNNHYADALFPAGATLVLIFLACLGLERVFAGHKRAIRLAMIVLVFTSTLSAFFLIGLYSGSVLRWGTLFGFFLFMSATGFWALAKIRSRGAATDRLRWLIVYVLLVDPATVAFFHERAVLSRQFSEAKTALQQSTPDGLELTSAKATYTARSVLVRKGKDVMMLNQADMLSRLPEMAIDGGTARVTSRTFNHVSVVVNVPVQGNLFVRDTWDPYWSATVNQKPTEVNHALGIFKSIPVPAGKSTVDLSFRPVRLEIVLWLSYLTLLALVFALPFVRDDRFPASVTA